AKIFYPPAIVIDVSTVTPGGAPNLELDLYDEYVSRFSSPAIKSNSAPNSIPTYARDELYYYVTDFDGSVFSSMTMNNDTGVLDYRVQSVPQGNCTFINVVFVVK
ncbi:MAG: hypothetical protein AAFR14_11915, partial [Bacteroidota bacterium]